MKSLRLLVNEFTSIHALILVGLVGGLGVSIVDRAGAQTSGTWLNTGSLNISRQGHTATMLPNGQVLVVGGENATGFLDSAELYNPSTGQWAITGRMTTPRINHKAVPLQNGEVLVCGGDNSTGSLSSAELYNFSTGQWKATGSMTIPRALHGATLLHNGQVLVAPAEAILPDHLATLPNYMTQTQAPGERVVVCKTFISLRWCCCKTAALWR